MELLLPQMGLIVWILLSIFLIILPIVAFVSLLRSEFKDSTTKLIWVLVIFFVPVAGSIFYFLIGRKQRVKLA